MHADKKLCASTLGTLVGFLSGSGNNPLPSLRDARVALMSFLHPSAPGSTIITKLL